MNNSILQSQKTWHAVYVASRQEKKVDQLLKERGIESYLPLIKTLRIWSDRKKIVEFPLFSGYVFVHVSSDEHLVVLQTRGVVNFVKSSGKIGVVYDSEIASIKQLIALGYHLDVVPGVRMSKGDHVKITSGPLKNLEGVILEDSDDEYFNIFLEGIGCNIRVKLPAGILKKSA